MSRNPNIHIPSGSGEFRSLVHKLLKLFDHEIISYFCS